MSGGDLYGWWFEHDLNLSKVCVASTICFGFASLSNNVVSTFVISSCGARSTLGSLRVCALCFVCYCVRTFWLLILWVIGGSLGFGRRHTLFSHFLHGLVSSISSFVVLPFGGGSWTLFCVFVEDEGTTWFCRVAHSLSEGYGWYIPTTTHRGFLLSDGV